MNDAHRVIRTAALATFLVAAQGAWAQSLPFELPPLIPNQPVTVYDVPGVPDERGCVKQCFRDDSPCDPPLFKKADNRCRNVNSRG